MSEKQCRYINEGYGKGNISDEADFLSWSARFFVGKKIKDHGCPTCIPAPASAKDKRTEYLGDCIVDCRGFKYAGKEIVPKTFYLHVLITDQSEIDKHVETD